MVLIYPSPLFYLNISSRPPRYTPGRAEPSIADDRFAETDFPPVTATESRFVHRLKRAVDLPDFVQAWRDERTIARATAGKDADWFFEAAPRENLDWLLVDLSDLVDAITEGSTPNRVDARPEVQSAAGRPRLARPGANAGPCAAHPAGRDDRI